MSWVGGGELVRDEDGCGNNHHHHLRHHPRLSQIGAIESIWESEGLGDWDADANDDCFGRQKNVIRAAFAFAPTSFVLPAVSHSHHPARPAAGGFTSLWPIFVHISSISTILRQSYLSLRFGVFDPLQLQRSKQGQDSILLIKVS